MHAESPTPIEPSSPYRLAWFDVGAGASGDMLCGALVDAGVPLEVLQAAVDTALPGAVRWRSELATRAGLRAARVFPELSRAVVTDRRWGAIRELLHTAEFAEEVRGSVLQVFRALADAEAQVHGVPVDDVHFHELGAVDTIADVVGFCAALAHLGVDEVIASPMAVGSGRVDTAHGRLPVPVPAVVALCAGWHVLTGGEGESTTPTGAALITTLARQCSPLPPMQLLAAGTGAGARDTPGHPNVTRVLLGSASTGHPGAEGVSPMQTVLETNVDDLDPRVWPEVLHELLTAGAADAWLQPIVMKKGRPAHTLSVLAPADRVAGLRAVIFATTSTIGLREFPVTKHALDRTVEHVEVAGRPIRVKVALQHGLIAHATPEFEDVASLATELGRPVRDLLEAATAATVAAGLVAGAVLPAPAVT